MMALNAADTRKWWESPIHTAYNIYVFVIGLTFLGFGLGVQLVVLVESHRRSDAHFVHTEILTIALNLLTLVPFGMVVRRSVRRLLRDAQPR